MPSFARAAVAALVVAAIVPVVYAQPSQPERLYNEALKRDAALRREKVAAVDPKAPPAPPTKPQQ